MARMRNVIGALALGLCTFAMGTSALAAPTPSGRPDYEVMVVLESDEMPTFEYKRALEAPEFREAKDDLKKFRAAMIEEAKKALAKKRGYFERIYGETMDRLARIRVRAISLFDHRRGERQELRRYSEL